MCWWFATETPNSPSCLHLVRATVKKWSFKVFVLATAILHCEGHPLHCEPPPICNFCNTTFTVEHFFLEYHWYMIQRRYNLPTSLAVVLRRNALIFTCLFGFLEEYYLWRDIWSSIVVNKILQWIRAAPIISNGSLEGLDLYSYIFSFVYLLLFSLNSHLSLLSDFKWFRKRLYHPIFLCVANYFRRVFNNSSHKCHIQGVLFCFP